MYLTILYLIQTHLKINKINPLKNKNEKIDFLSLFERNFIL